MELLLLSVRSLLAADISDKDRLEYKREEGIRKYPEERIGKEEEEEFPLQNMQGFSMYQTSFIARKR